MPKTRNAIPERDTWRLEDIYATDELWNAEYQKVSDAVAGIEAFRGKLGALDALKQALDLCFELRRLALKLYSYARMRRDENNARAAYQALADRAQALEVRLGTACAFIAPELLALPEPYLLEAASAPGFEDYRVYLNELIRQRPHTLSAAEERIVAMAGEIAAAPETIYDMLSDADMRFPEARDQEGNAREVTHSSYIELLMSRDAALRKSAFESMYNTFKSYASTIPSIYAASVKADLFGAQTGRFGSALEAALFPDEVPVSVYDNLIEVIHRHLPGLSKLVALNARQNGIGNPAMHDLYVPVSLGFDIKLPFDEGYQLVCDCLRALGDDYVGVLREARERRWIDPFESEGKSSGAYSWGTYDTHPYVLMNYREDLDSLLTIAHEMGHSMHTYYSCKAQPFPTSDYSLFVAEVASTVNEVLMLLELLDRHPEKQAQAYLLHNLLDGFRTTVFRQTMFAEFEKASHALAEAGEALTAESLNKLYAGLNRLYYPDVQQDELIAHEWMRIPHFYRAFYVYKYATGFSAATAIASAIRSEGASAVERYRRFLSAGSSLPPIEALKIAGIDMSTGQPVEQALDLFERLLTRYEDALGYREPIPKPDQSGGLTPAMRR